MVQDNQNSLEKFKSMHEQLNRDIEEKRREFLRKLHPLIRNWQGQLPNLRDILRPEEIDWLIAESVMYDDSDDDDSYDDDALINIDPEPLVDFVISTGYKDEPKVDESGKPSSRRTTPLHLMSEYRSDVASKLFQIYDRFDVNYTDEDGSTHFHVACMAGCYEVVKRFLEFGQDPDCLVEKTGESPLYKAVQTFDRQMVELLLRAGADPNLGDKDGWTPLHYMSYRDDDADLPKILFELSEEFSKPVKINAQDTLGVTPLHLAMEWRMETTNIKFLLEKGASLNIADAEGLTPLHYICKRDELHTEESLVEVVFKICKEIDQSVQVDVRDRKGRTPLQWAVANLMPSTVEVLLNNGADLSNFVFPTETYFAEGFAKDEYENNQIQFKLSLVSGALAVVECLENRGYKLERSDALTIMKFFDEYELYERLVHFKKCRNYDEEFTQKAKEISINPNLSLYDLIQSRPKEASKTITYSDHCKLASIKDFWKLPKRPNKDYCAAHLCEKLSRGFFRRWALDSFLKLTRNQLPVLCCDVIVENLTNEDLWRVCLADTSQSS